MGIAGAHSDIGGGYSDRLREHIDVRTPVVIAGKARRDPESSSEFSRMLHERASTKGEGTSIIPIIIWKWARYTRSGPKRVVVGLFTESVRV